VDKILVLARWSIDYAGAIGVLLYVVTVPNGYEIDTFDGNAVLYVPEAFQMAPNLPSRNPQLLTSPSGMS
jgi:hypothetical protein